MTTVLVLCFGCGDQADQATVTGLVTLDGQPLPRGVVTFGSAGEVQGAPASGQVQGDGRYLVQIGRSGAVAAGEYIVTVAARAPSIDNPSGGPPTPGPLITPQRYGNAAQSGLRYRIRPGENVIDIALSTATGDATTGEDSTADADDRIGVSVDVASGESAQATRDDAPTDSSSKADDSAGSDGAAGESEGA